MRMCHRAVIVFAMVVALSVATVGTVLAANQPSRINSWWTVSSSNHNTHADAYGNYLEPSDDCGNGRHFKAIWLPPIQSGGSINTYKVADRWEVEATGRYQIRTNQITLPNGRVITLPVMFTRWVDMPANSINVNAVGTTNGGQYPEVTGRVNFGSADRGSVTLRVRGQFDGTWGDRSPRSGLYCIGG